MTNRLLSPISVILLATAFAGACSTQSKGTSAAAPAATFTPAATEGSLSAQAAPSPSGEPRTYDAVKAAVDRVEAAAKAADGSMSWDMLTASGQATMSREDYVKVVQGCPTLLASNAMLSIALNAGGTSATVTSSAPPAQGGQPYTWNMIYENGHWRRQPSDGAMRWMSLGADKALPVLRDGSYC